MIYPVTPNGVEHYERRRRIARKPIVIYPVTPNGVEHFNIGEDDKKQDLVIYPVTPNGVEHTSPAVNRPGLSR